MDPRVVPFALRERSTAIAKDRERKSQTSRNAEADLPTGIGSPIFTPHQTRTICQRITRVNEEEYRVKRGYPRDRQVDYITPHAAQVATRCACIPYTSGTIELLEDFRCSSRFLASVSQPFLVFACYVSSQCETPSVLACRLCRRRAVSLGSLTNWLDQGYSMLGPKFGQ